MILPAETIFVGNIPDARLVAAQTAWLKLKAEDFYEAQKWLKLFGDELRTKIAEPFVCPVSNEDIAAALVASLRYRYWNCTYEWNAAPDAACPFDVIVFAQG